MDLRRWGEFAFGIGVLMCGGAFLLLAVERLNAPILAAPQPALIAATGAPAVSAPVPPTVAVVRREPIVFVRRPIRAGRPKIPHLIAARPRPTPVPIVAAAPIPPLARPIAAPTVYERHHPASRPTAKSATANPRQPHEHPVATVRRPDAKRSPISSMLAVANPAYRPKVPNARNPRSERTPEPPIGYDDHPVLVRSDGPSAAMPTMEPVQVELTTTHLGR